MHDELLRLQSTIAEAAPALTVEVQDQLLAGATLPAIARRRFPDDPTQAKREAARLRLAVWRARPRIAAVLALEGVVLPRAGWQHVREALQQARAAEGAQP